MEPKPKLNIVDIHIKNLQDEWDYTTEELNSIREKFIDICQCGFWDGVEYEKNKPTVFTAYGKRGDFE